MWFVLSMDYLLARYKSKAEAVWEAQTTQDTRKRPKRIEAGFYELGRYWIATKPAAIKHGWSEERLAEDPERGAHAAANKREEEE